MNPNGNSFEKFPKKRVVNELNPTYGLTKKARNVFLGNGSNERPCPYVVPPPRPSKPQQQFAVMVPRCNQRLPAANTDSPYFQNRAPVPVPAPAPFVALPKKPKNDGKRPQQCLLSGTVGKVLLWQSLRVHLSLRCLFEIWGKLDYVRNGPTPGLKIFMMRDNDNGPVIKVMFYEIDRPLLALTPGQTVSVVGVLRERSCLHAFKVNTVTAEDLILSQHIVFICDIAAKDAVKSV